MTKGRQIDVNDDLMGRLFCDDKCPSVSSEVADFSAKVCSMKPSKLA